MADASEFRARARKNRELSDARDRRPRSTGGRHPLAALSRVVGNRTVAGLIQRKPAPDAADTLGTATGSALLVDDAARPGPGQMRKSEFLARVEDAVCRAADQELAGTEWSSAGCPWIAYWLSVYARREPARIERAVRLYGGMGGGIVDAAEYVPAISARVREGVRTWLATGAIPTIPPALREAVGPAGRMVPLGPRAPRIQRKAGADTTAPDVHPDTVRTQLGRGQTLDPSARSRMQSALGMDLSGVRVHDDPGAARLAASLDARAFTVGEHVAFATGEYRPGTPLGDALLAHELAHVAQQGAAGGGSTAAPAAGPTLERQADATAAGALTALWSGAKELADDVRRNAWPRLRGGLELQRCPDRSSSSSSSTPAVPAHPSLADKAKALGGRTVVMDSYSKYQKKTWNWFFSPNRTLTARAGKPSEFDDWSDWDDMHWQSRQVIADLAGQDTSRLARTSAVLRDLKAAYGRWPSDTFATFWGAPGGTPTNTCNIFVGDSLFLDGRNQLRPGQKKYYGAEEVYEGAGAFTRIDRSHAAKGDIVAWDYGHVEVVTSVDHGNDEFCSRGGYRTPMGGRKCGGSQRKISASNIRFLRIQR